MTTTKVRRTLTLDPDVVEALDNDPVGLSAAINAILREEVARRTRRAGLARRVADLEADDGPPDPADVERFARWMV